MLQFTLKRPLNPAGSLTRCAAVLLLFACAPAWADLYTYTDEAGVLHITDSPTDARYRLTVVEPQRYDPGWCRCQGKHQRQAQEIAGTRMHIARRCV